MDHKIDTRRLDKQNSKKNREKGPYSAKHIRLIEHNIELSSLRNSGSTQTAQVNQDISKVKVKGKK